ncbi:MAG: transposase, partial [Chloroflexota bacterium]
RDGQGNVSESYVREPDFLVDELFFDEVVDDTAEGVEQPTEEAELTLEEILATGASNSDRSEDEDEEISVNDLSVQDSQDQVDIDLLSEVLDAAEAGADAFYDDSGVITDQEASGSTEAEAVYDDSGEVLDSAEAVEPQIVEESAASDEVYVDLDEDEDDDPFAFPEPDPVDVWGESAADLATTEESLDEVEAVSDAVEDVWDEPEFAIDDAWGEPAPESQYSPPMTKMSVLDDHILRWNLGPDIVIDTYDDPRVTQLAVSLTQASLESTGEAVLLTRSYELVAYEGALSDADIAEFMSVIVDGWEDVEETQARIRYLTLSSNGLDYMVYSRRTHEDFILSMVFAGQTSLRDIRQQGKRIVAALKSVPDTPPEIEDDPEVSLDPDDESNRAVTKPSRGGLRLEAEVTANAELMDYSFVWLLRDPNLALEHPTGEAINAGLRVQLVEQGWQVHALKVEEDYVYLYAGVPGDLEPQGVVRELQERSAKIAQKQDAMLKPNLLWAESYFVLSPGRELNVQEIQQYINFCRM